MVPIIKHSADGQSEYNFDHFRSEIFQICESHKTEGRASAFAFILYNEQHPHVNMVLNEKEYWNALHSISGHDLTIFSFHTRNPTKFHPDITDTQFSYYMEQVVLNESQDVSDILKEHFGADEDIKLPCLLFFQTTPVGISDTYLFRLKEQDVQNTYTAMKRIISVAAETVRELKGNEHIDDIEIFRQLVEEILFKKAADNITSYSKVITLPIIFEVIKYLV